MTLQQHEEQTELWELNHVYFEVDYDDYLGFKHLQDYCRPGIKKFLDSRRRKASS